MSKTTINERPVSALPPEPINPHLLLRPPKLSFIIISLLFSLLMNLLPLSEKIYLWRPDFVALVLFFWCTWSPRYVGIGVGFFFGLLMDVADATVLGQHALFYTALAFGADTFRRRMLSFPLWQQSIYVAALLAICAALVFVVRMMSGGEPPSWTFFVVPPLSAILWPVIRFILQWPQRKESAAY